MTMRQDTLVDATLTAAPTRPLQGRSLGGPEAIKQSLGKRSLPAITSGILSTAWLNG